jgi:hypothetical protein
VRSVPGAPTIPDVIGVLSKRGEGLHLWILVRVGAFGSAEELLLPWETGVIAPLLGVKFDQVSSGGTGMEPAGLPTGEISLFFTPGLSWSKQQS